MPIFGVSGMPASPQILIKANTGQIPRVRNCSKNFVISFYLFFTLSLWVELLLLSLPFYRRESWVKSLLHGYMTCREFHDWRNGPTVGHPPSLMGSRWLEGWEAVRLLFSFFFCFFLGRTIGRRGTSLGGQCRASNSNFKLNLSWVWGQSLKSDLLVSALPACWQDCQI